MGTTRAVGAGLPAAQLMDFWLWLWLGFVERETVLARLTPSPGHADTRTALGRELATLERLSTLLSAALPRDPPGAADGRTFARLRCGLDAEATTALVDKLRGVADGHAAPLLRRAIDVLEQARASPPPSPARGAAIELWAWLTGAEADRRGALAALAAVPGPRGTRELTDELRLLQTIQGGVRRGQPDVIASHPHEAGWLGARQPFQPAAALELARVLRRAEPDFDRHAGEWHVGPLVAATAARLEALAGPAAAPSATSRAEAESRPSPPSARERIIGALAAGAPEAQRSGAERFIGRRVVNEPGARGMSLLDADLGPDHAWRATILPGDFDEAAEFSAAGAAGYELFLLCAADSTIKAVHQRIDRSPHGRRWFAPCPTPAWLFRAASTLDLAWFDVAAPARARMLGLLVSLTSPATVTVGVESTPEATPARAPRRPARRQRH